MQESNVDRFLRESSKSYKNCQVKNYARRNSLQRKTIGIENERKLLQSERGREEKQLREHLKQMQIDKMKHTLVQNMRDQRSRSKSPREPVYEDDEDENEYNTETYRIAPLLYSPATSPSPRRKKLSLEERGRHYASQRRRRESKEFEDLEMDTKTGQLLQPFNVAKRLLSPRSPRSPRSLNSKDTRVRSNTIGTSSGISRPQTSSPSFRKKQSELSDGSSSSPVSSLEDLYWIGAPEATKSVRRQKKSIEEQHLSAELLKYSTKSNSFVN